MVGRKRARSPYTIVTLCRFGRWLSRALCPWLRFFPRLTDPVDGHISLEHQAQYTLMAPVSPLILGFPIVPLALNLLKRRA